MANIYVQAFKELIDEIIRENRNNPERAKQLIMNKMLREAKKAFKPQYCQKIKMHAVRRLVELGFSANELEKLLEE